jgi:DNA polymerase-4
MCIRDRVTLAARFEAHGPYRAGKPREKWSATTRIAATDDSFPLISALDQLWPALATKLRCNRVHTIAVSFDDIRPARGQQLNLFEADQPSRPTAALSTAMDRINARFGRNAVMLGPKETGRVNLIGAKIAFGRIPDAAEFHE